MNIKVTALTVNEKSINTKSLDQWQNILSGFETDSVVLILASVLWTLCNMYFTNTELIYAEYIIPSSSIVRVHFQFQGCLVVFFIFFFKF